ncbi:MAG: hypothetical protein ABR999_02785 [Methanoregula sp.]|uniref:hypothetical protein n=1 Tax=Methanoregula sp. TaxID=2052170 RepID=UPI003D0B4B0F
MDRIVIGSASKGGQISISFDSSDLNESVKRVDIAVQVRDHLLERLAAGGART